MKKIFLTFSTFSFIFDFRKWFVLGGRCFVSRNKAYTCCRGRAFLEIEISHFMIHFVTGCFEIGIQIEQSQKEY
jgi:hypothetical protein